MGPVIPCGDHLIERLARTLGAEELSVAVQPIVFIDLILAHSFLDQQLGHVQLSLGRFNLVERPDEGNTNGAAVIALCVRALIVPAATLVCRPIATDQEIVTDVVKVARLYVIGLDLAHLEHALALQMGTLIKRWL